MADGERRYRILGVLGQGGFGRVYKARLQGPQGFVKDVAIKLLTDLDAPEIELKRFRDESRILGLVRDRAVVNVDPPTRLDGRWAVVMEYVDGESLHGIRKRLRTLPARVALGIVAECARALDKVYRAAGPDGEPLRLLHRDIKPANIQVTPSGEIKILDFGIARADFEGREAITTNHIGGTLGYIAPERLHGIEGPAGDVFSLGVVLRVILTGVVPKRHRQARLEAATVTDSNMSLALSLCDEMTELNPEDRPTAREVEDRCNDLIPKLAGPTLRTWAEEHVRVDGPEVEDEMIGNILTETMASVVVGVEDSQNLMESDTMGSASSRMVLAAALGGFSSVALALIVVGVLFAAGWAVQGGLSGPTSPTEVAVEADDSDEADGTADGDGEEVPADDGSADADEEGTVDEEEPDAAPGPPAVSPKPAPAAAPAPAPAAATFPITITSAPMGATVWIDGKKVGATPLIDLRLTEGSHTLRLQSGDERIERGVTVGKRLANRFVWRVGEPLQVGF